MKYYFKSYYNRMNFIGSVISAGASLLGGALGNKASAKEAQVARNHSDEQLQNRHQWEADDLRKAGRNPILYSGSSPSTGSSAMASQQNIASNIPTDTASQRSDAKTKQGKLALEQELLKSQIDLLSSQASSARATANNQNSQAELTDTQNTQQSRLSPYYTGVGEVAEWSKAKYDQLKGSDAWFRNLPKFGKGIKNKAKTTYQKWRN